MFQDAGACGWLSALRAEGPRSPGAPGPKRLDWGAKYAQCCTIGAKCAHLQPESAVLLRQQRRLLWNIIWRHGSCFVHGKAANAAKENICRIEMEQVRADREEAVERDAGHVARAARAGRRVLARLRARVPGKEPGAGKATARLTAREMARAGAPGPGIAEGGQRRVRAGSCGRYR